MLLFRVAVHPAHQQNEKDTQTSVLFALLTTLTGCVHISKTFLFWIGDALYALPFRVGSLLGKAFSRTNFRQLLA